MTRPRPTAPATALFLTAALAAGCTGSGHTPAVTAAPVRTPAAGPSMPARSAPAVVTEAEHRAAGEAAGELLGVAGPGTARSSSVPAAPPAAISSGTAALLGGEAEVWSDTTVTRGRWQVRVACTGTGSVTAYAAAPSVVGRVGLVGVTDRWRTGRVAVRCGRAPTAFDAASPGPDGLAVLVSAAEGAGLTGVAFTLGGSRRASG